MTGSQTSGGTGDRLDLRRATIYLRSSLNDFLQAANQFFPAGAVIGAQCSLENGGVRDDIGGRTCGKIADGQHTGLAGIRLTGDQRFQRQIDVNPNVNGSMELWG